MVILIRHSESEYNAYGTLEPNVKLTEYGKELAKTLTHEVDLCVCSNLRRARETLDYSNIKYSNVIFTDLCEEYYNGNIVNYYNGCDDLKKESEQDLSIRIEKFISMLQELQSKYKRICVITHSDFLYKMTGFYFKNCYWMEYKIQ